MDGNLRLLASGIKTVAATATPECLSTTLPVGTRIWVGAKMGAAGAGNTNLNTESVWVGNATSQDRVLVSTNYEGFWLPTGDPSKVFVKIEEAGPPADGVSYEIWG